MARRTDTELPNGRQRSYTVSDIDELKLALKSRDDEIEALNKKIEILTKPKEEKKESKTVQEESEDDSEPELEQDRPFIIEGGEVYLRN